MVDSTKTYKDIYNEYKGFGYYPKDKFISGCICTVLEKLKENATTRAKFIKEIFLDNADFDISPSRTPREAYFHMKGKYDELVRFFNIEEWELLSEKEQKMLINMKAKEVAEV